MSLLERPTLFDRNVRNANRRTNSVITASAQHSDETLLQLYVERQDKKALEILCERHTPLVLSVCANLLSESHDIEDACQSIFLKLTSKAGTIRKRNSLAPWLHRVARAEAIQIHRNKKRHKATEFSEQLDSGTSDEQESDSILSVQEQMELLHDELDQLPEKYRGPIILCFLQGKSRLEAAESLGATDASVKASLMRGRELLRKRLLKRGIALTTVLTIWEGAQASAAEWGQHLAAQTVSHCLTANTATNTISISTKLSTAFSKVASKNIAWSLALMLGTVTMGSWLWLSLSSGGGPSALLGAILSTSPEDEIEAIKVLDQYASTLDEFQTLKFHIERNSYEVGGAFTEETWRYKHKGDFSARDGWWRYRYKYIGNGYRAQLFPVFGATEQIMTTEGYSQFSHAFTVSNELMTPDSHPEGDLWRVCSGITWADGSPEAQRLINQNRNSNLEVLGFLPYDASRRLPELMKSYQPRITGHEVIDGHPTVVVMSEGYYGRHTVWLDPEAGYLPRKIESVKERDDLFDGWPLHLILPHNDATDRRPNLAYQRMIVTVDGIEIDHVDDGFVMKNFEVTLNRTYSDESEFNTRFEYQLSKFSRQVAEEELAMTLQIPQGTSVFVTNDPSTEYIWHDGQPVKAPQELPEVKPFQVLDESNSLTE
ncbi:ECF RNA polymerase sigma factor SigW [Polystyrenella longa]|uniref:ECF RNA polymerase sigma factor SigW n=1 Tax=Polystyrenella longa TaxID=2528007 RepID=A0A518CM03_9PLAN|nr:sigma-70 family RNA polymerase sigma factor [Polystyrenella longa]QDU80214.1 ECF RNA polymerase sigma factor SigW [Polystyrenella longa]